MNRIAILTFALAAMAGCSNAGGSPLAATNGLRGALPVPGSASQYLSHVVVIVQENRTFENFFAGYPGANAPMQGCAIPEQGSGSARVRHRTSSGCPPGDVVVPLQKITFDGPDLPHNWRSAKVSYDRGKMDGFSVYGTAGEYQAYEYVDPQVSQPYWSLAQQYALADEMFPTEFGGSFTAHLTLVAGNDDISQNPSEAEVDFPNGAPDDCDSPPGTRSSYITIHDDEHFYKGPYPCFDQWNTMAQVLDAAGISWKYYATRLLSGGFWEPFEASKYVRYGNDWNNDIIAPETTVLTDAANGNLASVDWVSPSKIDSDHPGDGDQGPSWVGSVVNAIGQSSYWPTTAVIVVWDDYGGWYDNVIPPQLDYRGLGERIPCLIISPYAKQGYVSHVQYEFGSILRFIEEVNALPPGSIGPISEGYTDGRATSLDDAFDFTKTPRAFTPFKLKYPASHFLHERPSNEPPDND